MKLKVTYVDGRTVEITAKPKDYVAFERQYGFPMSVFADDDTPTRMEWIYYLAWSPLHRAKQEPRAFDEFLDDVEEVDIVAEKEAVAPFPQGPSDGTSSESPA